MLEQLRQRLRALEKPAGIADGAATLPLDIAAIDAALGGGLARGALHEIAAASEAHLPAATGFTLGLAALPSPHQSPSSFRGAGFAREPGIQKQIQKLHLDSGPAPSARPGMTKHILWLAEDMALAESGAPYGPGLDAFGLAPERLLTVAAAHRCDLLWAMEEALRCRAVGAVIGEVRDSAVITMTPLRRLSLAAAESGALALLLRASPADDASPAATRWIVGAAPNDCLAAQLVRNRRGPVGSWILEWSDSDERFLLATHAQPVAAPALDRPHRKVA